MLYIFYYFVFLLMFIYRFYAFHIYFLLPIFLLPFILRCFYMGISSFLFIEYKLSSHLLCFCPTLFLIYIYFYLFLIGGQLLYNAVLVLNYSLLITLSYLIFNSINLFLSRVFFLISRTSFTLHFLPTFSLYFPHSLLFFIHYNLNSHLFSIFALKCIKLSPIFFL